VRALSIRFSQVLMRAQSAVPSKHAEHMHQELMRTLIIRARADAFSSVWIRIRMVPYSRRAKMMSNINLVYL
jgi:hypothetical protein